MADEYESLPSASPATHMFAGAAAGVAEHSVMYPIDLVKTRMQSLRPSPGAKYHSIMHAFSEVLRDGPRAAYRGIGAVLIGAGPAHALYFAAYEEIKDRLSKNPGHNPLVNGFAGTIATLLHDACMNPVEVIKQRMQVYASPHRNIFMCALSIWRKEGLLAFYRSYSTQLTMNIPFQASNFIVYEAARQQFNPSGSYDPRVHVAAGGLAGAVAAAITNPLDVVKTLLNTQEQQVVQSVGKSYLSGMSVAFLTVYREKGIAGFTRGLSARVIYQTPSTAICWFVYELFKHLIKSEQSALTTTDSVQVSSLQRTDSIGGIASSQCTHR